MRHVLRRRSVRAEIVRRALAREDVTAETIARASGVSIDRAAAELRAVVDLRSGIATQPVAERGAVNDSSLSVSLNWRAVLEGAARLFSGARA